MATRYDYPALRTFAIDKLEKASLSAVERIRLAREFDIPSWEEPAYVELCERDEHLTMAEAEVLGLEAVLNVGIVRERELRRRWREAEAVNEAIKGEEVGRLGAVEESATTLERGSTQTGLPIGSNGETASSPEPAPAPDPVPAPESVPEDSKHYMSIFILCALTTH